MLRDMDLVRRILLEMEESNDSRPGIMTYEDVDDEVTSYHVKLLYDAGLIDAFDVSTPTTLIWKVKTLTWQGHEFLDAARDDSRWATAKSTVSAKMGSLSFELLSLKLFELARQQMGL